MQKFTEKRSKMGGCIEANSLYTGIVTLMASAESGIGSKNSGFRFPKCHKDRSYFAADTVYRGGPPPG